MHLALAPLHVESAGAGAPLVLLHGWALHGGLFTPIVHAFAEGHRVHVVDLPGHGYSAPLHPWSLDRVVAQLDAHFADCDRIRLLGWSLGGAIAMQWAQRSPSRIERLLLVTATPKFVAAPDWPHGMEAATLERFADELRVAFGATLSRFLTLQTRGGDAAHSVLAALRRDVLARGEPDRASLDAALAVLRSIDLRETARHLQQPALVIAGTHDTLVPLGACEWLGRALPHGRVEVIEGAGHVPFLSHRDRFLADALAFLDDH
jgi:pimeloyl-[acyl-carrier protein] methyl ester esterase